MTADGRTEETAELRQKLEALKEVIKSNGLAVREPSRISPAMRHPPKSPQPCAPSDYSPSADHQPRQPADPDSLTPSRQPADCNAFTQSRQLADPPTFTPPPVEEVQSVQFDFTEPQGEWSPHASILQQSTPSVAADPVANPIPMDPSPGGQSFGTLVISHSGRSKYLGPTAASEWLKDVRLASLRC